MEQVAQKMSSTAPKIKPRIQTAKKVQIQRPSDPVVESTNVFQNVKKNGNILEFTLAPTHVSYANTIRRGILTLVETVAFNADIEEHTGSTTDVKITKNTTPISNEMLAHRIGLLPIHVQNPLTWDTEEYSFQLRVKNETAEPMDITADMIEVYRNTGPESEPEKVASRKFFHPHPMTGSTALLAVLKGKIGAQKAEEIECTMKTSVGNGKQNARYNPVSQCSYKYTLDPDVEKRKAVFNAWLTTNKKVNPAELDSEPQRKTDLEKEFATMEAARCYLEKNGEPYSFDFTIESVGVLAPENILARALDNIQLRCVRYVAMKVGDLPENVKMNPADARFIGYDFLFKGEDHTMGNLLQTWIEQNLMEDGPVSFVGYKVPHPLRDEMVLRIGIKMKPDAKKGDTEIEAVAAISAAAKGCVEMFRNWRAGLQPYLSEAAPAPTVEVSSPNQPRASSEEAAAAPSNP